MYLGGLQNYLAIYVSLKIASAYDLSKFFKPATVEPKEKLNY